MSTDIDATETDQADGQVTVQLLSSTRAFTPGVLQDEAPVPLYSCVNIAVQTNEGDDEQDNTPWISERTKRILIRVLVTVAILAVLSTISAIESALGRDIIDTEELVKAVKGEVDILISNSHNASAGLPKV